MTRLVPLSIVAGTLACLLAAGSAQAAPATSGILAKLTDTAVASTQVEKVGWRKHRRWHRHRWHRRCYWRYGHWHCRRGHRHRRHHHWH